MSESEQLFEWINSRYEACRRGEISEETYMKELAEYNAKIAKLEKNTKEKIVEKNEDGSLKRVRSTSIAGLRSKLLDELKKS